MLHVGIKYACITTTAFTFAHLLLLSTTANQPSLHSPFLLVFSFSHNHPLPSLVAVCSFFLGFAFSSLDVHCRNKITGHRGAWHFRLEKNAEALISCLSDKHKKRAQLGTASQQMAFPGRELASIPGRDWQTCPGRALANVPRQGTGKASQAGTAKRAQAGHWQTFPGRELASVPRQGTGKRPRQGLQACPGRACTLANVPRQGTGKRPRQGLQNVPRQGTGKCSQAGNRRRPQAGDSGCSHAGNCRHCKSLAAICHQPRGATPPPTSRVLCDELACSLTGRGAIVNNCFCTFFCTRGRLMYERL